MSQLFETEMHAPKVPFLSRFGSVVIFDTPTTLTLQGEQAKRLQGRWSWWFLSLWVTQTYLLYTCFEWYQYHSTIWKSYLKSQIAHLRQRCQADPAQGVRKKPLEILRFRQKFGHRKITYGPSLNAFTNLCGPFMKFRSCGFTASIWGLEIGKRLKQSGHTVKWQ